MCSVACDASNAYHKKDQNETTNDVIYPFPSLNWKK